MSESRPSHGKRRLGLLTLLMLLLPLSHNWTLKYDFQIGTDIDLLVKLLLMVVAILLVMLRGVTRWFPIALLWSLTLSTCFGLTQSIDQKLLNEIILSTFNFFGPIAITLYLVQQPPNGDTLHTLYRLIATLFIVLSVYIAYVFFFAPDLITQLKFGDDIAANIFLIRGGRLSLTFSEPSHAGFILGFLVLYFITNRVKRRNGLDYLLLAACLVMLMATGAKIAIPITILSIAMALSGRFAGPATTVIGHSAILFSLVGYFFLDQIYAAIAGLPYELQETFVTRLSFFFSTFEFLAINPLGYGFSKIFQTDVVGVICSRTDQAISHQLSVSELSFYCSDPGLFFGAKEQFSLMALHFGVPGLIAFVLLFRHLKNLCSDPCYLAYLTYFLLSVMFYERFTGINPGIYPLLAMGLIYHEKKTQDSVHLAVHS